MRRVIGVALAVVAVAVPAVASADRAATNNKTFQYQVGLWGDLPVFGGAGQPRRAQPHC